MGKVKYYTPEYKKKAVEMFRNIGYHDTLEILGISDHALRLWVDQEKEGELDYVYMDAKKLKQLESKAAKGDKDAQEELCRYYADEGEVSDETRIEWFKKAAEKGWPEAQYRMAEDDYFYQENMGREKYNATKFKWYKKAAEQGHIEAQEALAECYEMGWGTEKDDSEAFRSHKKAAEQGDSYAQNELGDCYYLGEGVEENLTKAFQWYKKSAQQGNPLGLDNLGLCYSMGYGTTKNYKKAFELYKESAINHDYSHAQYHLGMCYLEGKGVERNDKEAKYWLQSAARKGDKSAQEQLEKMESACFITTAVCGSFNKPDSCYELTMFRDFRDNWLSKDDSGKSLISEYYKIAPQIVRAIDVRNDAKNIYLGIWNEYLLPCLKYIENKEFEACKEKYVSMVRNLAKKFLS